MVFAIWQLCSPQFEAKIRSFGVLGGYDLVLGGWVDRLALEIDQVSATSAESEVGEGIDEQFGRDWVLGQEWDNVNLRRAFVTLTLQIL